MSKVTVAFMDIEVFKMFSYEGVAYVKNEDDAAHIFGTKDITLFDPFVIVTLLNPDWTT